MLMSLHTNSVPRPDVHCHVIDIDRVSSTHHIGWHLADLSHTGRVVADGVDLSSSDIDLVWWRRSQTSQDLSAPYPDDQRTRIDNDCRSAFLGMLLTSFTGKWISHPWHTERAANKLYQLAVAKRAGFKVPRTLVTQYPDDVLSFCNSNARGTIAKPVTGGGARGPLLFTQLVTTTQISQLRESVSVSPTMYQEYIPGTTHIRLNCFGQKSYAATIETTDLDWRANLNVPVESWPVPASLHDNTRRVLDALGLEMGIVDLKVDSRGEVYWLEVNPQGQFLFLQPLTNDPYIQVFSDYLVSEAAALDRGDRTNALHAPRGERR